MNNLNPPTIVATEKRLANLESQLMAVREDNETLSKRLHRMRDNLATEAAKREDLETGVEALSAVMQKAVIKLSERMDSLSGNLEEQEETLAIAARMAASQKKAIAALNQMVRAEAKGSLALTQAIRVMEHRLTNLEAKMN